MGKELDYIFKNFKKRPVAFIGSGISKRYLDSPTWEDLLKKCFSIYNQNSAEYGLLKRNQKSDFPKMASIIENDFNDKKKKKIVTNQEEFPDIYNLYLNHKEKIDSGLESPFKVYVTYIYSTLKYNNCFENEKDYFIKFLQNCTNIITTNYDTLLETCSQYSSVVGHTKIITDDCIGYGEVYKIHGSIEDSNSIILTDDDYKIFNNKSSFYHAKLLLSFIEQPIIFIGYSINDEYISNILSDIDSILTDEQKEILSKRIIFIDYSNTKEISLNRYKNITMTRIKTNDYIEIYKSAIKNIQQTLPINIIRIFQASIRKLIYEKNSIEAVQVTDLSNNSDNIRAIYLGERLITDNSSLFKPEDLINDIIFEDSSLPENDIIIKKVFEEKNRFPRESYIPLFKYYNNSSYAKEDSKIKMKQITNIDINTVNIHSNSQKYQLSNLSSMSNIINSQSPEIVLQYILANIEKFTWDELVDYIKKIHPEHFRGDANTKYRKVIWYIDYLRYGKA